ncbi:NAD-P-binding protein [Mycena alexandri]|uniref:NAD-P-binding protein n=1 Tax=Mycena alexandri TaxID=1745969 RepID=A0AAD6T592_9AGAR|nr:NAD-P-binding protein [Mycena alexandri]
MPARKSVSEEDLVDLHGKVAIVTGGNTGIGYATIQMLARKGAKVYMAARDEGRALEAIKQLQAENLNDGSVHWLKLDLSDPRVAQATAKEFLKKETRLDILVNNAARSAGPNEIDKDGLLNMMVTNHISHFALTDALLPLMKETAKEGGSDVRIVNVSSGAHALVGPTTFATLESLNKDYGTSFTQSLSTYGNSKLANVLHINALQKRLTAESIAITCLAAHPGPIKTVGSNDFLTGIPFLSGFIKKYVAPLFFGPWRKGAMTVAFAAAGKEVVQEQERYRGAYLVPIATITQASSFARDERLQRELYDTTEKVIREMGL